MDSSATASSWTFPRMGRAFAILAGDRLSITATKESSTVFLTADSGVLCISGLKRGVSDLGESFLLAARTAFEGGV